MKNPILIMHDKVRPLFEKGGPFAILFPLFDAHDTFMFTSSEVTSKGTHVRDLLDLKRFMMTVIYALIPCTLFGIWNAGNQYNLAHTISPTLVANIVRGGLIVLPIIIVSYVAGGIWEIIFACVRKHEVNEGFLVTGLLFPLILPPEIPLWQVAVGVSFGVVIGKEIFGGTGMNVLNPALTARAFLFFAYPSQMSGDVWTSLGHGNVFVDVFTNRALPQVSDAFSGATPLGIVANVPANVSSAIEALDQLHFSFTNMFFGVMAGSIAETSTFLCLIGAAVLIISGIGSWQVMLSALIGVLTGGCLANHLGTSMMSQLPPYYHIVMGGFAFGAVFMLTDPVSSSATGIGKWIYGFLFGILVVIVRVANPAYPEGVMLSILFMNVMAPLIDSFVVDAHIKRRLKRG